MSSGDLHRAIAGLPDAALVPVGWVRELLADTGSDRGVLADLTCEKAAEELDRAPSTVRGWCGQGRLPGAYRLNGREWRIPPEGLRSFMRQAAEGEPEGDGTADLSAWRGHTQ